MDLSNSAKRSQFWKAHETSSRHLDRFRDKRKKLIEAAAGTEYTDAEGNHHTLINLLHMTAQAYTRSIAANNPRVLVTTEHEDLWLFAEEFQTALNNLIQEIRFAKTFRRIVMDAFFSVGIAKCYMAPTGEKQQIMNPDAPLLEPGFDASIEEWETYYDAQNLWVDPGKPAFERVSLDDFDFDTSVKDWELIRWATHRYRVPYDMALEDDRFDREVIANAGPNSKWGGGRTSRNPQDEASEISAPTAMDNDELEPMITLQDVWFPRTNTWGVVIADDSASKPLYMDSWDGPESGPFGLLSFGAVPDNIMPAAPAMHLRKLHELTNQTLRKAARQAKNQKTVLAVSGNDEDARVVKKSDDMEVVKVDSVDTMREMSFNGNFQEPLQFSQIVDGVFDRAAGNLSAMMGLGPQSGTAKQDQLIHDSVGASLQEIQTQVVDFVRDITENLGWMLWHDQNKEMTVGREIPGLDDPIVVHWTPDEREGDWGQYNFKLEPYSMAYKSPGQRVQEIVGVVTQVFAPLQQQLQAAGGMIDMQELTKQIADLSDLPRLNRVVKFGGLPVAPGSSPQGNAPGMPAHTQRDYVRESVSGGSTPHGQRIQNVQALGGQGAM